MPARPTSRSVTSSTRQLEDEESRAAPARASADDRIARQLNEILVVLVLGLPMIVGLAGIGGYVLARRALAPIEHLAAEARRITADRLHERLSVPNAHDEIGRLAGVFNDTLGRLESSFDQLRRFTADASHELRTPLAVIRGIGELGARQTRTPAEYKEAMGSMLEEVDRLTRLVDTLLQLSRGDAGTVRLSRDYVHLGDLARDVMSSLGILADERRQTFRITTPGARTSVRIVWCCGTRSRTLSTTPSSTARLGIHDRRGGRGRHAAGQPDRQGRGAGHSSRNIVRASSTGSIESTKAGPADRRYRPGPGDRQVGRGS